MKARRFSTIENMTKMSLTHVTDKGQMSFHDRELEQNVALSVRKRFDIKRINYTYVID